MSCCVLLCISFGKYKHRQADVRPAERDDCAEEIYSGGDEVDKTSNNGRKCIVKFSKR